jgi:hypothetical protein
MDQVHKRMTTEQVKVLFKGYCQGLLDRSAIEDVLGIGRSRFFALLNEYRHDPDRFSITYERRSRPRLPVRYAAIRDRLIKRDIKVSSPTIIARAKSLGCYQPHPRKKYMTVR